MKKIWLLPWLFIATIAFADTSDIVVNEVQPSITVWKLKDLRCYLSEKVCSVYYSKGYLDNGAFIEVDDLMVDFRNSTGEFGVPVTDYTDFINYLQTRIQAGDGFKEAITKAVKIKLGM